VYGTPANSVLAYYLEVTPPNCYNHFILKIPHGPVLVYLHQVQVTLMALPDAVHPRNQPMTVVVPSSPGRDGTEVCNFSERDQRTRRSATLNANQVQIVAEDRPHGGVEVFVEVDRCPLARGPGAGLEAQSL
jgi:hypothetical protein